MSSSGSIGTKTNGQVQPGDVPKLTSTGAYDSSIAPQMNGRNRSRREAFLNLRTIAEVCESEGFNPAETLVKILMDETQLDPKTRASLAASMIEYIQPKKKAIEHTGNREMTEEELNARIGAILSRARGEK